uniref:Sushi domain-containing protein n=1 Tax=Callorhinchus milii TaxID=7868 RepID=A0A4W3IG19_CALMI
MTTSPQQIDLLPFFCLFAGSCGRPDLNVPNVNMSVITKNSFKVGDRLRLTCDNGYVRKAGTSNLIHCEANQFQWSKPNLTCIRKAPDCSTSPAQPASAFGPSTSLPSPFGTPSHIPFASLPPLPPSRHVSRPSSSTVPSANLLPSLSSTLPYPNTPAPTPPARVQIPDCPGSWDVLPM